MAINIFSYNITQLMFSIVELWRSKITTGEVPYHYEHSMTVLVNEYERRTSTPCNTVATIEPLEEWYDGLSEEEKDHIRHTIKLAKLGLDN